MTEQLKTSSKRTQQGASRQGEFKNRRTSRSRRGNEADRRRAEAALFRLRLWLRRDRVVAKRRREARREGGSVFRDKIRLLTSAATILEPTLGFGISRVSAFGVPECIPVSGRASPARAAPASSCEYRKALPASSASSPRSSTGA